MRPLETLKSPDSANVAHRFLSLPETASQLPVEEAIKSVEDIQPSGRPIRFSVGLWESALRAFPLTSIPSLRAVSLVSPSVEPLLPEGSQKYLSGQLNRQYRLLVPLPVEIDYVQEGISVEVRAIDLWVVGPGLVAALQELKERLIEYFEILEDAPPETLGDLPKLHRTFLRMVLEKT